MTSVPHTPPQGTHGQNTSSQGALSSVQNLTRAKTLTRFKKSHYKIKKTDPKSELLGPCALTYSTVSGRERGLRHRDSSGAAFQEGGCARSSRLKLVSEGLHLLPPKLVSCRQRSLHSSALSVLSPTMQLSSQSVLATLSKNRGFEK